MDREGHGSWMKSQMRVTKSERLIVNLLRRLRRIRREAKVLQTDRERDNTTDPNILMGKLNEYDRERNKLYEATRREVALDAFGTRVLMHEVRRLVNEYERKAKNRDPK